MGKLLVRVVAMVAVTCTWAASAHGFSASTNVALVPDNHGDALGAGFLPTSDPAFTGIVFTNLPLASVSAANLASYDTVVLNQICDPLNEFSSAQRTALVNFVSGGGKLIIYDSDACGTTPVDYSWLPFAFTTNSPGQTGSNSGTLTIVEDNALSSPNGASAFFIDTALIPGQTDAVGDSNVMTTLDSHWCGDMSATNVNLVTGFVHAYATFGSGILIYTGLDTNSLSTSTIPGTGSGAANFAKIWLQELKLPNASTLTCSSPVAGGARKAPAPALGEAGLGVTAALLLLGGVRRLARRRASR